ncbi:MAG: hypothetical protein ACE5GX_01535 [Thermoanaerobaculia bacterium]
MAKRMVFVSIAACLVLGLARAEIAQAKAHVPLGKGQICKGAGTVQNVSIRRLQAKINAGACRLTVCVFNEVDSNDNLIRQFIFLPGDDCDPTDANGDGFCDATLSPRQIPSRISAVNVTPACTDPF